MRLSLHGFACLRPEPARRSARRAVGRVGSALPAPRSRPGRRAGSGSPTGCDDREKGTIGARPGRCHRHCDTDDKGRHACRTHGDRGRARTPSRLFGRAVRIRSVVTRIVHMGVDLCFCGVEQVAVGHFRPTHLEGGGDDVAGERLTGQASAGQRTLSTCHPLARRESGHGETALGVLQHGFDQLTGYPGPAEQAAPVSR